MRRRSQRCGRCFLSDVLIPVVGDQFFAANQDFLKNKMVNQAEPTMRNAEFSLIHEIVKIALTWMTLLSSSNVFLQSLQYFWASIWIALLTWMLLLVVAWVPSSLQCSTRCSVIFSNKFCNQEVNTWSAHRIWTTLDGNFQNQNAPLGRASCRQAFCTFGPPSPVVG